MKRLDVLVTALVADLSRSRASALIKDGRVTVDGEVITRAASKFDADAQITVDIPAPTPSHAVAQDIPLPIVFQDEHLAVIDKPAGMVVHPGAGHPDGTLVNALLHHIGDLSGIGGVERPGIVHRLDKGTSGLIVIAKHDVAHRHLSEQFAAHSAGRRYLAICSGQSPLPSGTIRSQLARHPSNRVKWATTTNESLGKHAVTHWRRLAKKGTVMLLECRLETGRTHQVRVHLSEKGWPLFGDSTYGKRARPPASIRDLIDPDRPLLHAWKLELTHPVSEQRLSWVAPPPADFQAVLDALGMGV